MPTPVKIFIVYAQEDKPVRDKLLRQLRPLAEKGEIELWSDHEIKPGALWDDEIRQRLADSAIILLLISDDFFASDYIRRVELQMALDLHARGQTRLVPVIARHCGWADMPALSRLQALPPEGRPVLSKEWDSADEPYLKIYEGLKAVAREIGQKQQKVATDARGVSEIPVRQGSRKWWLVWVAALTIAVWGLTKWFPPEKETAGQPQSEISQTVLPKTENSASNQPSEKREIASPGKKGEPEAGKNAPDKTVAQPALQKSKPPQAPVGKPPKDSVSQAAPPQPLFDRKLETSEGMTRIVKGNQVSFLNLEGKWLGRWFDYAENFHDGLAYVKAGKRYFWIDKFGNCVKDCE